MALTNAQIESRLKTLEAAVDTLQTVITNLASRKELKSLLNIRQSEIVTLQNDVASLKTQVAVLQS